MASEVATAEARWTAGNNPLFDFAFRTHHPDVQVAERRRALLSVPSLRSTSAKASDNVQPAAYRM
jgi:hypothetical protein